MVKVRKKSEANKTIILRDSSIHRKKTFLWKCVLGDVVFFPSSSLASSFISLSLLLYGSPFFWFSQQSVYKTEEKRKDLEEIA